ncbi:MAG: rod shape-determining protein RodA [Acidimicrobiia bacterium]|nr:rod shape-determining protein RodA [Acidimicrobiia bacterium]
MVSAAAKPAVSERPNNRPDYILLSAVLALSAFGALMIFSVTRFGLERSNVVTTVSMERQLIFVTAGLIAMAGFSVIDYRNLRDYLPLIYGGMLVLLFAVFLFDPVKGARRWIPLGFFNLQPSEFAKLATILALAYLLSRERETTLLPWKVIAQAIVLTLIPAVLIFGQPDLGTTLTFPFIVMVMLFGAGMRWRQFVAVVGGGALAVFVMFQVGILREHQLDRIKVFLDPSIDPQGIGYNLKQSKLAIGSGQIFGKGLFQGTQTNLSYVPEQETDFIFTAVGEQLGFVGGILVLAVFLIVIWRLLVIAVHAQDKFGSLLVMGVAGMMMFHVFINIGMTIGIAPVTGLPLPFLSQGGSFYMAMALSIGMANSVWLRRSRVRSETFAS